MFTKEITIHTIYTSPEHNYFTRPKFEIGDAPTIKHSEIKLTKNEGLPNDRFKNSKYPITLFSQEVLEEVSVFHGVDVDPELFRRNIIVSGVHLNSLIGKKFKIGEIEFEGMAHCAPCTWMDAVIGKKTYALMRGRGGLRVRVLSDGVLQCGENILSTEDKITLDPTTPLKRPNLPN